MPVLCSNYEVQWETPTCFLKRFFNSRIAAEKYAQLLAEQEFTKKVVYVEGDLMTVTFKDLSRGIES